MTKLLCFICLLLLIFQNVFCQEIENSDTIKYNSHPINIELFNISRPFSIVDISDNENFGIRRIPLFENLYQPTFKPLLNFNDFAKISKSNYSLRSFIDFQNNFIGTGFHVFNEANYRLNEKFLFGGNNFGTGSILEPPLINQSINDMSLKGASMFLQYKVNDKFKVETRISITNKQFPIH